MLISTLFAYKHELLTKAWEGAMASSFKNIEGFNGFSNFAIGEIEEVGTFSMFLKQRG